MQLDLKTVLAVLVLSVLAALPAAATASPSCASDGVTSVASMLVPTGC